MQEHTGSKTNANRAKKKGCGFVFLVLIAGLVACGLGYWGFSAYRNKQLSAKFEDRVDSFSSENITFSEEITYYDLDNPPENLISGEPVLNPSPPLPEEQPASSDSDSYQCADLSGIRLDVRDRAVIVFDSVNLRSFAEVPDDYDSNVVTELKKGATMTITGGPECAHNGTWWEVKTDSGYAGWVREFVPDGRLMDIASNTSSAPSTTTCPGALPTRVRTGITIQVTTSGKVPRLGIRPQPTLDSKKMFELPSGEKMSVLDGPVCANDSFFWYVDTPKGDGWVREGNTEFYFVDPLGQSTSPELEPQSPSSSSIPACPGSLSTRVQVGITICVTTSGKVPKLGIRPQPTLDSKKIFELKSGEQMSVLDGPVCANESYFWYINSAKGKGWVREGNTEFYFVDPLR